MMYGSAKDAVLHLTRCAATGLGEHNVEGQFRVSWRDRLLAKALGLEIAPPTAVRNL
jgi:hypothetical protein